MAGSGLSVEAVVAGCGGFGALAHGLGVNGEAEHGGQVRASHGGARLGPEDVAGRARVTEREPSPAPRPQRRPWSTYWQIDPRIVPEPRKIPPDLDSDY